MASSRTAHPTFTTRSVLAFVTAATLVVAFAPPAMGTPGEATNLGFCGGDDWEPEITAMTATYTS